MRNGQSSCNGSMLLRLRCLVDYFAALFLVQWQRLYLAETLFLLETVSRLQGLFVVILVGLVMVLVSFLALLDLMLNEFCASFIVL